TGGRMGTTGSPASMHTQPNRRTDHAANRRTESVAGPDGKSDGSGRDRHQDSPGIPNIHQST
ncbi:MAG: hypothetical protein ABGZ17_25495, partial [Planctomycetaceae bacterium]